MKKRVLAAGLGIGLALAGAGLLTACGGGNGNTPGENTQKDGLSIHTNFDTTYYVGQDLDVTGGILNYTKDGKTTQIAVTESMISGFTKDKAGNRNMIVTYEGETLLINYTVNELPTKPNVSTSKVYKSQEISSSNEGNEEKTVAYIRFHYVGNDVYFKVVEGDPEASSNYAYDAAIWDKPVEQHGLLIEGKLDTSFDMDKDVWTLTYSDTTSSIVKTYCTFNNVTENTFEYEIAQMSNSISYSFTFNMTKMDY